MFSRFYADVDVLGSFGKKGVNESKDPMKEAQTTPSLDRFKFLGMIHDYCKKNNLIDAITGEDNLNFKSQNDFVNMINDLMYFRNEKNADIQRTNRKLSTIFQH